MKQQWIKISLGIGRLDLAFKGPVTVALTLAALFGKIDQLLRHGSGRSGSRISRRQVEAALLAQLLPDLGLGLAERRLDKGLALQ